MSAEYDQVKKERFYLFLFVAINLIIKLIPASVLELGNDEVYYWTYAMFPDLSHFDHPPMVGLLIQLFTLNLTIDSELFIRAGSLFLSSANIILLFYLVKRILSRQSAFIAVILYISSFYFNIISGLFILPDTPQMFFVILAMFYGFPALTSANPSRKDSINLILFGLFVGLAFLSKYHSLFLWFGSGLFILFNKRIWFRKPALYLSILVTLICMAPVFYWNLNNHFISFTYHGSRIGLLQIHIDLISFMQFIVGQIFYQNPVLFIIYVISIYKIFRSIKNGISSMNQLLIYSGLPLILVFTVISLFRSALPHWTGPAYICLLILSSDHLAEIFKTNRRRVIGILSAASALLFILLLFGTLGINYGIVNLDKGTGIINKGENDFTLDMYGWKQAKEKFSGFLEKEGLPGKDNHRVAIVSNRWFPAAHLDYYIANPLGIKLVALGNLDRIHKYYWINKTRPITDNDRVFYVTDSRNYCSPEIYANCFSKIIPEDTLVIKRNNKIVKYLFIYDMIGFKCDSVLNSTFSN